MKQRSGSGEWILLFAIFVIATCGLIYELVAGTLASYLLGDSVTQFSTIIGAYLFSMGIGSFLSTYFTKDLLRWFIRIELLVGLVGGFSAAILFILFPVAESFRIILYSLVGLTGILVGLEIPILMRILKDKVEFKDLVSRVFTFDYIGALLASLIFPLLLVPHLGLIRTSLFFGILNISVGLYLSIRFAQEIFPSKYLRHAAILLIFIELMAFVYSERIMNYSETLAFNDRIIYSTSTPYQRIVITKNHREIRLFLNGNLQFSSADEYRYHEALVHPVLAACSSPKRVLVLGGGDGLAVREILKYPSVEYIQLVDLDGQMTRLFSQQQMLMELNARSLIHPKVHITNADAFVWLRSHHDQYDAVIIDFPDPSNYSIGKLYSTSFYRILSDILAPDGIAVIQSTSPYVAPKSFWCINETIREAGMYTRPYHNYVPSFGEWGYILAMHKPSYAMKQTFPSGLKYLDNYTMQLMFNFPQDMKLHQPVAVNKLNNQALIGYFQEEWQKYTDE